MGEEGKGAREMTVFLEDEMREGKIPKQIDAPRDEAAPDLEGNRVGSEKNLLVREDL